MNIGSGALPGDNSFVKFSSVPTLTNGILAPWLTVTGSDSAGLIGGSLATYDPVNGVRAITSYQASLTAGPTANVARRQPHPAHLRDGHRDDRQQRLDE